MFTFENVTYHDILRVPSLTINEFQKTCVVGESGSGKSTFLKLLNHMITPSDGQLLFRGKNVTELDPIAHRRDVVMLTQHPVLFGETVKENLLAGIRFAEQEEPDEAACKKAMERFRLHKDLEDEAETLSGGEQQRLALARMTLMVSPVYLLDEPTSSLDEDLEHEVMENFMTFAEEQKKTVIFVTHSSSVASAFSDQTIDFHEYTLQGKGSL
ncbi:ABC transporter ATP-binding protein [Halobacillus shinanisalinarum]|uniref:ABC transporter ATP-binding protein n=1 Tax=Halobacillus shinanisalinarum TaxID=2932258 RepID=A0ABY4H566_9BACI|nr:ABC transporter ATP-binding protein [Halobacillus shinanisalinarum]UOQ95298.1 ABC transporter ATP-binding protein [Halobacillus shinanisalinarum]